MYLEGKTSNKILGGIYMLNLIFQDDSINAVFERNANISKHYANMISRLSEDIDTVVNDVYNEFEKDSENHRAIFITQLIEISFISYWLHQNSKAKTGYE